MLRRLFAVPAILILALFGVTASQAQGLYIYSPDTGHNIAGLFAQYWASHGASWAYGSPLTEEFDERQADGITMRVQYFERAVLEFHPEAHAPFQIQPRRLGAAALNALYPNNSLPAAKPTGAAVPPTRTPGAPTPTRVPTLTPTKEPTATEEAAPPTETAVPEPVNPYCVPEGLEGYSACAVVDNPTPEQRTVVDVIGVLYQDGAPAGGINMTTVWHYASSDETCDTGVTNDQGIADCSRDISTARVGREVRIDVTFVDPDGNQLATAQTIFTPR